MISIAATTPFTAPPTWAVLEQQLFDIMDQSVHPFLEKYTHPDGSLIGGEHISGSEDDFYESFYNWPLLYLLGGGDGLSDLGSGSAAMERHHPPIDQNGAGPQGIRTAR